MDLCQLRGAIARGVDRGLRDRVERIHIGRERRARACRGKDDLPWATSHTRDGHTACTGDGGQRIERGLHCGGTGIVGDGAGRVCSKSQSEGATGRLASDDANAHIHLIGQRHVLPELSHCRLCLGMRSHRAHEQAQRIPLDHRLSGDRHR